MKETWLAAKKELDLLVGRWRTLLLVLIAPSLVLVLAVGESDVPAIRLLVAGAPAETAKDEVFSRLLRTLQESSSYAVSTQQEKAADPLERMTRDGFDLLLNYGEAGATSNVSVYTAETDPLRARDLEEAAAGITRAYALIRFRQQAGTEPPLFPEVSWAKSLFYEELFMLGTFPINPLFEYFPQAVDRRFSMLPAAVALVLGLLPFMLAAGSSAQRIWASPEPSSAGTWGRSASEVLGKSLAASLVTATSFGLTLLLEQSLHDLDVKAGVIRFFLFLLPALLASAFLGIGIASASRSPVDLTVLAALYVLLLVFLGSFSVPLAARPGLLQGVACLLPSTFVRPALARWIFGAGLGLPMLKPAAGLVLQSLVYGSSATVLWRRRGKKAVSQPRPVAAGQAA